MDYYYYHEANQFAFYRVPKALFTDRRFSHISTDAKLLYGLMLDRMSLSIKNKWFDDKGRVYIYFTLDDVQEQMGIGHGKVVKLFAELDNAKGVGLIERVKQGQGRPTIIYVKNFVTAEDPENPPAGTKNPDFRKSEVKNSEKRKPRLPQNGSADFPKTEGNYTEYSDTDMNNLSISQDSAPAASSPDDGSELADLMDEYRDIFKTNIEYDLLCQKAAVDTGMLDEMVEVMVCTAISRLPLISIGKEDYPASYVKKRLLSLDSSHIEYVFDSLAETTTRISNIKAYLLTTLFNAPQTIENYYSARVQHDLNSP